MLRRLKLKIRPRNCITPGCRNLPALRNTGESWNASWFEPPNKKHIIAVFEHEWSKYCDRCRLEHIKLRRLEEQFKRGDQLTGLGGGES